MFNRVLLIIPVVFIVSKTDISACSTNICLSWNINGTQLTLTCKIKEVRVRVVINDPSGKTQAHCLPLSPSCEVYFNNTSFFYEPSSGDFVFHVNGLDGKNIYGNWACRHGSKGDASYAMVSREGSVDNHDISTRTVTTHRKITTGVSKTESKGIENTPQPIKQDMFNTMEHKREMTSQLDKTVDIGTTVSKTSRNNNIEKDPKVTNNEMHQSEKMYYVIVGGGIVFILGMFIFLNAWVSRKCRTVVLTGPQNENPQPQSQINVNISRNGSSDDYSSHYESINENEMLHLSSSNTQNETTISEMHAYDAVDSSISSSDKSYLDVIADDEYLAPNIFTDDDYLTPYASLQLRKPYPCHCSANLSSVEDK